MSQVLTHQVSMDGITASDAERSERSVAAVAGILGAIALAVYFAAPAFLAWPYAGASSAAILSYANAHSTLFFAGAWFQVTGTLLCVVLFLALVRLSGAATSLAGMVTALACAVLLATVVIEAAFLVAVPVAAAAGDAATATSMFALSNGGFLRVFPLAPASATLIGLGLVLRRSNLLGASLATAALGLGVAFELAGLAAIVLPGALVVLAILSAGQAIWVVAASLKLGILAGPATRPVASRS